MALNRPSTSLVAVATVAGVLAFGARNAHADNTIGLEPTGAAERQVEWTQARSPNLVHSLVSQTGRHIQVVATTNAPVEIDGACPPPSQYPGWRLDTSKSPKPGRESAEVDELSVERTGENGTFRLRTTAPSRPGQALRTQVKCVHVEKGKKTGDGPDGKPNTGDDVYEEIVNDTEVLTAEIGAVAGWPGNGTAPLEPFPFRGNGEEGDSNDDEGSAEESDSTPQGLMRGELFAQISTTSPTVGKPGANLGVLLGGEYDPLAHSWYGRVPVGLLYRMAVRPETITDPRGQNPVAFDTRSHCGFATIGWRPGNDYIRAGVDLGAGVCHAEGGRVVSPDLPGNGEAELDPVTDVAGRISAQIEAGLPNVGVRGSADVVMGRHDAFQYFGVQVGPYIRFEF